MINLPRLGAIKIEFPLWLALWLAAFTANSLANSTQTSASAEFDHQLWDEILGQFVLVQNNGQSTWVDYASLQQQPEKLQQYLAQLSAVKKSTFDGWPKADRLAFLINAYNAWTVKLIIDNYPVASIKDIGSLLQSPWKKPFVELFGGTTTLDDIEHKRIRGAGRYEDPRIHFAVNCASISCPPLRPEAYVGARLNSQLDAQTELFLSDRSKNSRRGKLLLLSPLFDWYRGDFEKGWLGYHALGDFLLHYKKALKLSEKNAGLLREGNMNMQFMDYDWRLNDITNAPKQ